MKLPPDFETHPIVKSEQDDDPCILCAIWDEPAWFWHSEVPPPDSLAEDLAKVREAARLLLIELQLLALRQLQRWLG